MKQGEEFGEDTIRLNIMRQKWKESEREEDRWSGFSSEKATCSENKLSERHSI